MSPRTVTEAATIQRGSDEIGGNRITTFWVHRLAINQVMSLNSRFVYHIKAYAFNDLILRCSSLMGIIIMLLLSAKVAILSF